MKQPLLTLLSLLLSVTCLLTAAWPAQAAEETPSGPLELASGHVVILDGGGYPAVQLQRWLTFALADYETSLQYDFGSKADRAANPHVKLIKASQKIEAADQDVLIAVGDTSHLSADDRQLLKDNPGMAIVRRQGRVIVVAGNPLRDQWTGTFTAVNELLDKLGVRMYAPNPLWIAKPRQLVYSGSDIVRPLVFKTNHLAPYIKENQDWLRMNNAARLTINVNHNLANIFPPDKYGQSHPEIYELRGGERRVPFSTGTKIWQPCLSAKALPELTMDYIRERMKGKTRVTYISLGMMDIGFDCQCEDCQKSVRETGSYSHLYFSYVNKVARLCQKEYRDLTLTAYGYANAKKPPAGMTFEPNVAVGYVTKLYLEADPAQSQGHRANILEFASHGAHWFIHDWNFSGVSPRASLPHIAQFIRWGAQNHMIGAYTEWSGEQNYYLDGIKYWALMKLMSDPYVNVDLLWKQYCDDMFGSASETMFHFYKHFEDKFTYAPDHIQLNDLPRQEPALYSPQDLAWERATLERAIVMTKDDPQVAARLAMVMHQFEGHELFAKASYEPNRLGRAFTGDGVNRDLLAWYLNDDASTIDAAIHWYNEKRNIPPATGKLETALGLLPAMIGNYSRGIATLLGQIRTQAIAQVDPALTGKARIDAIQQQSKVVLQENKPEKYLPDRLKLFEGLTTKTLFVPTLPAMPKLDGKLDDAFWKQAADLTDFSLSETLRISANVTKGKIARVGDALVVAIDCQQQGKVWYETPVEATTGTHIWRESGVEFYFGPQPAQDEKPVYAQYVINAVGAFRGFGQALNNREGVQVAAALDDQNNHYTLEIVIPLKGPKYDYTKEKAITFNIGRNVYTSNSYAAQELIGWSPIFTSMQFIESRGMIAFE